MIKTAQGVLKQRTELLSKNKAYGLTIHAARVILGLIFLVFGIRKKTLYDFN